MITIKQFMILKYLVCFGEELREYLKKDSLFHSEPAFHQLVDRMRLMKLITSKRNYGKCKFKLTRKGWKEYIKFYSMVIKDV